MVTIKFAFWKSCVYDNVSCGRIVPVCDGNRYVRRQLFVNVLYFIMAINGFIQSNFFFVHLVLLKVCSCSGYNFLKIVKKNIIFFCTNPL